MSSRPRVSCTCTPLPHLLFTQAKAFSECLNHKPTVSHLTPASVAKNDLFKARKLKAAFTRTSPAADTQERLCCQLYVPLSLTCRVQEHLQPSGHETWTSTLVAKIFRWRETMKHRRSSSRRTDFVTCSYCKRQTTLIVTLSARIWVCRKHYYYFFFLSVFRLFARMHTRHRAAAELRSDGQTGSYRHLLLQCVSANTWQPVCCVRTRKLK